LLLGIKVRNTKKFYLYALNIGFSYNVDIINVMSILVRNVSFSYQNKTLFQNFNLEIPDEKIVCLLGSSGVGKTTLLRLISGLETGIDQLSLEANITSSDNQPLHNRIAYMAQQDLLLPWFSVMDNVLLGYKLRGKVTGQLKQQAVAMLAKVGLEKERLQFPSSLSVGMRQRAALVRTFLENRPIILMDEPFSALDVINRIRLQNLAAQIFRGKTVVLITHDPLEALRLADIIYVLSGSPVTASEPVFPYGEIPRNPSNPEVLKLHAKLLQELLAAHGAEHENTG
jgi:putative hydroxymethylpyrimidine transport system ATP-binding protein